MRPVVVLIFHAMAPDGAGPLVRGLAEARHSLAQGQRAAFLAAGADTAEIVAGPADGRSFGDRLGTAIRGQVGGAGGDLGGGVVVLGSGSIPLARAADLRRFLAVAAGPRGHALANNRYSADVVAISRAADLMDLPPLPADNALPRWLEERAGVAVADLRSRWRLGVDVDTPLDLIVLGGATAWHGGAAVRGDAAIRGGAAGRGGTAGRGRAHGLLPGVVPDGGHGTEPLIGERLAALSEVLTNRRAEVLIAGRVSSATLKWLESGVACRIRALVEERGLRAASRLAQSGGTTDSRPPRSVLGELLDRDGPESLALTVARLADAAVVDTRILLAHRHGPDESEWPEAEDRFASDLLEPESITDPWLRALTQSAATTSADHPIILGGHTMVNGGLRLIAARARLAARARAGAS